MEKLKLVFLFYLVCFSLSPFLAQVYNNSKLNLILIQSKSDSIQKIERSAAFKFHKLINEYRLKNGADALAWDETLWLTCRNHDVWMDSGSELSHTQKQGSKNFTGKSPGDRYLFTSNNEGECSWSGENALYNWAKSGNTIDEIANSISTASFNQWKNSPGHNQNMLAKQSKVHGVAFYLSKDGRIWGTDMFAYNSNYKKYGLENKQPEINLKEGITIQPNLQEIKSSVKKLIKLDLDGAKNNLMKALYNLPNLAIAPGAVINKTMEKAAVHHSEYMACAKLLTHEENKNKNKFYATTGSRRIMKASKGLYFFKKNKTITESVAFLETDIGIFNTDSLAKIINYQLNKESKAEGIIINVGYGISLKRVKNQLKIYITRIGSIKKSSEVQKGLLVGK